MVDPIFILAPGRSFSSIISVMLGQHPELFDIPETNLATAETVGDWLAASDGLRRPLLRPGLLRAIAYLETGEQTSSGVAQAQHWLQQHGAMSTAELYQMLRNSVAPKGLVEKSPVSMNEMAYLDRMVRFASDARFLHISRHPHANCRSIMDVAWYRKGLEAGSPESYDHATQPPTFDPQFYWLAVHQRILAFQSGIDPANWYHIRGEDLLSDPEAALPRLCRWLGIRADAEAIAAMQRPERSPFARFGPNGAVGGNDPNFLDNPIFRRAAPPSAPLSGALPWRADGAGFTPQVQALARQFGYEDGPVAAAVPLRAPQARARKLVRIEPDGQGSPMPHCNVLDNSMSALRPLTALSRVQHIPYPTFGGINFGAYTGEHYAVAVYEGPREPALVTFDLATGERIWQTPMDMMAQANDFPGRWVGGVLLAKLHFDDGSVEHRIFCGNRREFVCLDAEGGVVWRKSQADIMGKTDDPLGTPRCIRISRDNRIFFFSGQGNLIKMDPLTGTLDDIYRLDDVAAVEGRVIPGRFKVTQSVVLMGDMVYAQAAFYPADPDIDTVRCPVLLLRFQITGTGEARPARLSAVDAQGRAPDRAPVSVIANGLQGGSPSGMMRSDNVPVIIANGHFPEGGFGVRAIADEAGTLREQWVMPIRDPGDPTVTAAPVNDPETGLYICTTKLQMLFVRDAAHRRGTILPDLSVAAIDLLTPEFRHAATHAELSSPMTLARHPGQAGFICYVGLSVDTTLSPEPYAVLSALEITCTETELSARPIWTGPLALDGAGNPMPAPRSYAQPAIFRYTTPQGGEQTGLVMGTIRNGVSIFR